MRINGVGVVSDESCAVAFGGCTTVPLRSGGPAVFSCWRDQGDAIAKRCSVQSHPRKKPFDSLNVMLFTRTDPNEPCLGTQTLILVTASPWYGSLQ